jgi:hypothetical protein
MVNTKEDGSHAGGWFTRRRMVHTKEDGSPQEDGLHAAGWVHTQDRGTVELHPHEKRTKAIT